MDDDSDDNDDDDLYLPTHKISFVMMCGTLIFAMCPLAEYL